MKKGVKIALIVAAVMVVTGLVIGLIGFSALGFSFSMLRNVPSNEQSQTVTGEVSAVDISSSSIDVVLASSKDEKVRVDTRSPEKVSYRVENISGTLTVTEQDDRRWIDRISLFSEPSTMTVYLPAREYRQLTVELLSGDLDIPEGFVFDSVKLFASSGDIRMAADCRRKLDVSGNTGRIILSGLETDDITVENSTGRVELSDCRGGDLSVTCSTSKVSLDNVVMSGALTVSVTTGDIDLNRVDAQSLELNTTTGDITGSLLSPKQFSAKSTTGNAEVPSSSGKGVCTAITTTGDIKLTVE